MTAAYCPAIMSASLGIEVFYEDLEYLARKLSATQNPTAEQLLQAAEHVHYLCESVGIEIIGLQPFLFYEGLVDRRKHGQLIEKMELWLQLAQKLGTDTIQIPVNFLPDQLTGDYGTIAFDLREVADMGAKEDPPVRFAYENLCWSTHIDTWEKVWDICKRVGRPNFGTTPDAEADLQASLQAMTREVDVNKVFYIQIVDAERMLTPLAIIHELGYKGWVSMELFSRTMSMQGLKVPAQHSARGITAWRKLEQRLGLNQ
ncbi:xylose isomerase-like protein [Nemania abortiva]|nr:xylose isomerase-like protein [Nemania abortiva]